MKSINEIKLEDLNKLEMSNINGGGEGYARLFGRSVRGAFVQFALGPLIGTTVNRYLDGL